MQRRKKQLLGLGGLVLVAAMMLAACTMPSPGASAADEIFRGSVGLQVKVASGENTSALNIISPVDQETVVHNSFEAKISYTNLEGMNVYLQKKGSSDKVALSGCTVTPSTEPQECSVQVTLDDVLTPENRQAEYILSAEGTGAAAVADSVNFFFRAAHLVFEEEYNSANGNPKVRALLNEKVKLARIQVYDANNKPMFVDGNGNETPLTVPVDHAGVPSGEYVVELPFKDYNLANGIYRAVLVAYETETPSNDSMIAISTAVNIAYPKGYKPGGNPGGGPGNNPDNPDKPDKPGDGDNTDKPNVPGTGVNLFKDLNISRADYVITGLVAFGVVTAFAVFLIVRRNRR